jgi:transposase
MMGLKERVFAPLVAVSLEELVPQDHFYRHLQQVLDLSFVYDLVRECYAAVGRASIDPVVFFKLQLVMFFEDIRSERLLMRQVADRLSVRWYLGYDLDEPLPDHSSLSKIRLRYGLEVFRRFFEAIVEQCQQAKLVWGKELYFDSTQVNANADLDSLAPRFAVEAREAIQEHLAALFAPEPAKPETTEESSGDVPLPQQQPADTSCPRPTPLPTIISEAQREELAVDNAARHDWIAEEGRQQREVHGLYRRTADFRISTTDPDATPMRLKGGGIHLGYCCGRRQTPDHPGSAGHARRGDGQSTHARSASSMSSFAGACGPDRSLAILCMERLRISQPSKTLTFGLTFPYQIGSI